MKNTIFTIGHSNLQIDDFLNLLKEFKIEVLVDVRAKPYSKYSPHFNRENLTLYFKKQKIKYLFLGDLLGGPSKDEEYILLNNSIDYTRRLKEKDFLGGIDRLKKGLDKNYTIALMCSEKDPYECHRHLLIANKLIDEGIEVLHIIEKNKVIEASSIGFIQESLLCGINIS